MKYIFPTVALLIAAINLYAQDCVEINGVCWATRNVDAPGTFTQNPEDAGMFYQWNRNIGWSSTNPKVNSNGGTTWDSSMPTDTTWAQTNDPCPAGYRLPTQAEQTALVNAGSTWTANYNGTGVAGRIFGSGTAVVFFPTAGYRLSSDGALNSTDTLGFYWSSTQYDSSSAYTVICSGARVARTPRTSGFSVRCVSE